MALTITIPGAVSTTTGSTAPAVLTVGVGAPGQGVPAGGTSGQVLQKLSGVSYDTGWLTLPADFITSVTAPLAVASGVLSVDLSAYSTTAQAAALYYPLSGNPSAFLTASALTPYLTSADAAITYQTLAGMSSYLTTADAATTYYLQTNPAGYVTAATAPVTSVATRTGAITLAVADVSGAAPTASPTLTGVPLSTTAAVDTNTTQIATTAYVVGNGYAKLASPTFTGTPTLPTGSIGVTQSPGNNTTALATTAFVTAAVPAFATIAQSQQGDSTTTAMSPFDTITAMMAEGYRPALALSGGTSGTGASNNIVSLAFTQVIGPNVLTAGYAYVITNTAGAYSTASTSTNTIKFNKPIWISGVYDTANATYQGDANTETKAYLGVSMTSGDDPTGAAIGWWKLGGASTPFNLMVHNGTTLTKVASATSTANAGTPFRWMVYSDGAGNVTLYINGVSVATTALGPTGSAQANVGQFTAAVKAGVTATTRMVQDLTYPKIYVAPQ